MVTHSVGYRVLMLEPEKLVGGWGYRLLWF